MYKKAISIMSVMLIVFLCFPFKAFAITGGGKTITSNSYSYNNGDVTVYVRVNGNKGEENYTGGDRMFSYPHSFTVTLANNSTDFQVADTNNFTIDLYSGSSNTFTSSENNWGSEVTSYSDNMTAPRILMYPSGDLAGHVLVSFSDSDLLVLNPNETRTYNFTIDFIQYANVNNTPLNGSTAYSYFTYTGTVGFYSRPSSFSANTIDDFISNNSLPNSVIPYLQYLISQGVEDQEYYQQIVDTYIYLNHYANRTTILTTYSPTMYSVDGNVGAINATIYRPYEINVDLEALGVGGNNQYLYDYILDFPVYYNVRFSNGTDNTYLMNRNYYQIPKVKLNTNANYSVLGETIDIINESGCYPYSVWANYVNINFDELYQNRALMMGRSNYHCEYIVHYYIGVSGINISNFSFSTSNITFDDSNFYQPTFTLQSYNFFGSIGKNFADIRDRLQEILNGYNTNQPAASDVDQGSNAIQDESDDNHQTELSYFEQTNQALSTTGIENYQFNNEQIGGIGGVSNDFTLVYNSLGSWTSVYIFSLTLSLGLAIIRHVRPIHRSKEE